ncbi:MAG: 2-C-methyl-D-erythritol 4-phosphate cytidylyltransferase [Akkermansiaceae bacterium]
MKLTAIIVAAGSSRRMGFDKLLAPMAGKPVLQHSIEAFMNCDEVGEVILVCPRERLSQIDIEFSSKSIRIIDGGLDRHDSVAAGLSLLPGAADETDSYIAVHDGARPLITPCQISRVYHDARKHDCAASASRVSDTIKRADDHGVVQESVSRENLWLMQTPQVFRSDLLMKAYRKVRSDGKRVTDEVSALQLIGHSTYLVENPGPNPKITYPHDIPQAEKLLTADS